MEQIDNKKIAEAAHFILESEAILVTAGAGLGVDSGLPDFRGDEGFWKAYPAYKDLGLNFLNLAKPKWFKIDPELAWGFYGHRLELYRSVKPHDGFKILKSFISLVGDGFVFTSNVDGHFQKAGFDESKIVECHGTLNYLQCLNNCGFVLQSSEAVIIQVDPKTFRAMGELPVCFGCGGLLRPNVLMFNDPDWDSKASFESQDQIWEWLNNLSLARKRLTIIECGAGTDISTVRDFSEDVLHSIRGSKLIRINKRDVEGPRGIISLKGSAKHILNLLNLSVSRSG